MRSDHVEYSLVLDVLDDQVVDSDGIPIGRVDDVELELDADGLLVLTGLLIGATALAPRIGGLTGTLMQAAATRLGESGHRSAAEGPSVPAALITELRPLVRLAAPLNALPQVAGLERWLAEHIVGRLTGTRDERQ